MSKEPQQPTGLLARWRERRRQKATRYRENQHRAEQGQRRDLDRAARNDKSTRPM